MTDLADKKSVSDEKARIGRAAAGRAIVWRTLLGDVDGRKFCWWLLERANIYSGTFRGEDTHVASFLQGQRELMIPIQAEMIRADPRNYQVMVIEHAAKEAAEQLKEQDERPSDTAS